MDKSIKELNGHSGCKVYLKQDDEGMLFVEKTGDIKRNLERLNTLTSLNYPVPKIYYSDENKIRMQYIHGLDVKNYLIHNSIKKLSEFIVSTLDSFSTTTSHEKDYTEVYNKKIQSIENHNLPFTKEELISKLPSKLPQSVYHGDLTLENIMATKDGFYMIDAITTEYDSYIFDIAKMRQDLQCKWFLREDTINLDVKLKNLQKKILEHYPKADNDTLLILMLLRVLEHCERNDNNYIFVKNNINSLWKNMKR